MRSIRLPSLLLTMAVVAPAFGATFIVPEDRVLIDDADAIIQGYVLETESVFDQEGLRTETQLYISTVLKGDLYEGSLLTIREPGGQIGEVSLVLPGVPRFSHGEEVLLLLNEHSNGYWETANFALGKFTRVETDQFETYLVRERDEICGWTPEFGPVKERARVEWRFVEYIEAVVRGESRDVDYEVDYTEACLLREKELGAATEALSDYLLSCNCRWNNGASAVFSTNGTQAGIGDSVGAVDVGGGVWNADSDSNVNYSRGGTTVRSQGFMNFCDDPADSPSDGCLAATNAVIFNDPSNEVDGGLILAIGGPWFGGSHSFAGSSFATISLGQVVVQNGISLTQGQFEAMMAHELGHSMGFRHPDEGGPPPSDGSSSTAQLMSSVLSRSSAFLSQWDVDAVRAIYGSGVVTCTPVSITSHPQSTSIVSGASTSLSVSVSGSGPFTFQWYRGTSPSTANPVGTNSSSFNTGALTETTSFWVRVTNCSGAETANSNTATVTVTECTPPAVTVEPQDASITSGSSAMLSIGATGTPTITYQWYRHIGNDIFQHVTSASTATSFNTGLLTATQQYLCVVRNPCATGDTIRSRVVTVTVTTSCTPPAITAQPTNRSIVQGQTTTLMVSATGTSLNYQWFEGAMGVMTKPVGTNAPSFTTPPLGATTSYWVRVSNSCGGANSQAATVTVTPSCVAATITSQPASVTILSGQTTTLTVGATGVPAVTYQWHEGESGDFSKPVGTNSASFTTPALTATTKYWVLVSTPCGGAGSKTATVTVTSNCPAGRLCSLNGRFELDLSVRDHRTNKFGNGVPLQQNDLFGFFSLPEFTGDPNNPEVFVKMLDGRLITGNFWVFFGGLTDLEYTLRVSDTVAGTTKTYFKPGGLSNGGFDVGSGVTPETCVGEVDGTPAGGEAPTVCSPASNRLCLNQSRFRVELSARDQRTGNTAIGQSIPQGNLFGYFALPGLTGDPNNPEVFVKVVDGRVVNNFYWVFFSGLTDFEYTLTVVDTFTGQRKTYTKAPGSACGFFDTNAF